MRQLCYAMGDSPTEKPVTHPCVLPALSVRGHLLPVLGAKDGNHFHRRSTTALNAAKREDCDESKLITQLTFNHANTYS